MQLYKSHFYPHFSKQQQDLVDPISSILFCLSLHGSTQTTCLERKNATRPSYRIPPIKSVPSFLSLSIIQMVEIKISSVYCYRELLKEQNKKAS